MIQLDQLLDAILRHPGVEHVSILGADGLPVRTRGEPPGLAVDALAALAPDVAAAAATLGSAAHRGGFVTAALEFTAGVVILAPLSSDLIFAVVLRPGVGFAELLAELHIQRDRIAPLL